MHQTSDVTKIFLIIELYVTVLVFHWSTKPESSHWSKGSEKESEKERKKESNERVRDRERERKGVCGKYRNMEIE